MKPRVLVATRNADLRDPLARRVADLCRLTFTASTTSTYWNIMRKSPRGVVLDSRLPGLDSLELTHAVRHSATPELLVVTLGPIKHADYLAALKTCEQVVVGRSLGAVVDILRSRLDPLASRRIREVRYQPEENVFFVTFRDSKTYELAREVIEADDGSALVGEPQVTNSGDAFVVRQKSGNRYDVAWDFVLYHEEPNYPHYKGRAEQQAAELARALRIGKRVRLFREKRGWRLGDLARRTGIQPPNLSRLESGEHVPSLQTLERLAGTLGVRVADLVAA